MCACSAVYFGMSIIVMFRIVGSGWVSATDATPITVDGDPLTRRFETGVVQASLVPEAALGQLRVLNLSFDRTLVR